jgi:hypothetical protein
MEDSSSSLLLFFWNQIANQSQLGSSVWMEHLRLIATWLRRVVSAKVSDWRMNVIKDFESSLTIFPAWSTIFKANKKRIRLGRPSTPGVP